jgi:hypothetical protein
VEAVERTLDSRVFATADITRYSRTEDDEEEDDDRKRRR